MHRITTFQSWISKIYLLAGTPAWIAAYDSSNTFSQAIPYVSNNGNLGSGIPIGGGAPENTNEAIAIYRNVNGVWQLLTMYPTF